MVYLLSSIISDLTKGLIFFSLFLSPLSTNLNFKPLYKVGKPPTKAWFMQMPSDPVQEPAILSLWTTTQEKNFILHHYSWNLLFSIHMLIFSPVIITFRLDKVWKYHLFIWVPEAFSFLTYHCRSLLNELWMVLWVAWVQGGGIMVSHRFTLFTFNNICLRLGNKWNPCTW